METSIQSVILRWRGCDKKDNGQEMSDKKCWTAFNGVTYLYISLHFTKLVLLHTLFC